MPLKSVRESMSVCVREAAPAEFSRYKEGLCHSKPEGKRIESKGAHRRKEINQRGNTRTEGRTFVNWRIASMLLHV